MTPNTPITKKVLLWIAIAIIVVGGFVFIRSLGGGEASLPDTLLVSEVSVGPADAIIGQDLLVVLSRLKATRLETSIFSDQAFQSLIDWSVAIAPQPQGRRNPFAPIGVGGVGSPR